MVWNLVALEPDSNRWLLLRPVLGQLGYRAVAVDNVRALESVIDAFDVDAVLIRPMGDIEEHARLVERFRRTGTRVFITAEIRRPQILSLYYTLGDQTRTVRMAPIALGTDMLRHARERVDRLPPVPEFGGVAVAANQRPVARLSENTERAPVRPALRGDHVAPERLKWIRLPAVVNG
ncbi:MAG: hypothetical protein JKY37_21420 [Nannocystaceae bacterium]|nr:hypothetical protein [Nannocystaceae bacterium]